MNPINSGVTVCENCKKETDKVILTAFTSDRKLSEPLQSASIRCNRCERSLAQREKFFRVTATFWYICKNGHTANRPSIESKEKTSKEWEGYFVCKECGEEMKIDGKKVG